MNRKETLKEYKINRHGTIVSPGKFEGEPLYVPYFWNDAVPDETFGASMFFGITDDDRKEFPEIGGHVYGLKLYESEQGFVYLTEYYSESEYISAVKETATMERLWE
jgi:hypothetical protein